MTSKPVALLLADLGVTKTHSRPYTSDDNPFSEAQFKTLKYRPDFPERFGSLEDARVFCQAFFAWYNGEHRHSGVGLMTPAAVHDGRAAVMHDARQQVLMTAYATHPERFVRVTAPTTRADSRGLDQPAEGTIGLAGWRRRHDLDRGRPTGRAES